MLANMSDEELAQHVWITSPQRTDIERELATRLLQRIDELEDLEAPHGANS